MPALLPLSLAQHEVLQDQRAFPRSPHLCIGGYSVLEGPLDARQLAQALRLLADEQPALRSCVSLAGNRLLAPGDPEIPQLECPPLRPGEDLDAAAQRCWAAWTAQPPDPAAAPAWAAAWLDAGAGRGAILLMAHHAVMDGWGTAQHMRRWAEWTSALVCGQPPPPADAEAWLRHLQDSEAYRRGEERERDAVFWLQELPQAPAPLFAPPPGAPATPAGSLPAARLVSLPATQAQRAAWAAAGAGEGHTEVAAFAAALAWQLGRLAGLDELVIGVPTLNRKGAAHRAALGMYVGVFCLRLNLRQARTPRELIAHTGQQLRRAMRHARYPVSQLARQLGLAREGRSSPFDLLLSFERQDFQLRFGHARVTHTRQLFSGRARYPLGLTVCDFGAGQDLALVAEGTASSPLLGDERQLALLLRRQLALVDAFAAQPDAPLDGLPLLPAAEREAVIEGLHANVAQLAEPQSVLERFAAQAALHPQAPALVGEQGLLRYGALATQVEHLACRLLQAAPLQPGDAVALALPRGPLLVAAMLAVHRAGAAFVPLDLEAPDARLQALLQTLRPRLWLGPAAEALRLAALHPGFLPADGGAAAPALPLPPWPRPEHAAYALFTSGSSGTPKAVQVSHGALARRFAWMAKVWDLGPADRSLQGTQPTFDPSLIELLLPLGLGASVAFPPPGRSAPERWAALAAQQGCTFTALVPTTLARLLDGIEALPAAERNRLRLRVACCGGEVLPPALAARWRALTGAQLWNVYGPTEACIFASAWACRDSDENPLPIGTPLDDTRLYVLDPEMQPLPLGTAGEIWIGGDALADGYLHEPERTAAAFRPDPFRPGGRVYRSGDRGLLDGAGRLQFLGRMDRQLKIRGQRVEPGEVEAALLALPGVAEAAVLGVGQPLRLHAWLAPARLDLPALQAQARQRLPELLLPAGWTLLDALPRSRTGKLDPSRLPPPDAAPRRGARAPATALEQTLLALLRKTLQREDLDPDDDFFAVGGDSLAALDWLTAVEAATGLHADLALLAQAPSVARLAQRLQAQAPPSPLALRLSNGQAGGPRLFLAASGHGDLLRFQALARALGPQVDLHMLQPPPGEPVASLAELAAAYGEHVRTAAGDTPFVLAGFSVGGVTALETARWLQARGPAPAAVLLLDTVFPRWLFRQPWLWKSLSWLTRHLYVQELSMNGRRLGAMFKDQGLVGQVLALHGYRPSPYEGPVLLLRTSGLRRWQNGLFGPWRRLLALREHEVSGLHGSVFEAGLVGGLAQCLLDTLPGAPPPPSPPA